jgi:acyl carrier protein phosphodiesterase
VNYLAHFYLADPEPELMFGNYIGDGVRGRDLSRFSENVQRGIRFHRFIDTYTDQHEEVLQAKTLFHETQNKFAGVVVDVLFDHVLANKWQQFHKLELNAFAEMCYETVGKQKHLMPIRSARFYEYMVSRNALKKYASPTGVEQVFIGMDSRTAYPSNMSLAVQRLEEVRSDFEAHFERFFPQLVEATTTWKKTN